MIGKTVIVKRTLRIRGKIQTDMSVKCRLRVKRRLGAECRMRTADWG